MRHLLCGLSALAVMTLGCDRDHPTKPADPVSPPAMTAAPQHQPAASVHHAGAANGAGHPDHPPIDCPLRQQGIDPHSLKPFEDVDKYIAFLERPDRAAWQKPDTVVEALRLTGSETVVDLGAGSGYFSFRFARALPSGKVVAVDVEPEMVRHIHHKAMTEGVANVEVVLGKPDDPHVPSDADLVFICDVLHHVTDRSGWLGRIFAKMNDGARIVLIEFKEGDLPQGPPAKVKLSRAELEALVQGAGFVGLQTDDKLLPYQIVVESKKPSG